MNRIERSLLVATAVVIVGGGGLYLVLRGRQAPSTVTAAPGSTDRTGTVPLAPETADVPDEGTPRLPGGGQLPGTKGGRAPVDARVPSGEDLSDPAKANALLRQHLAAENPRWD